jgi:hypothetical protein
MQPPVAGYSKSSLKAKKHGDFKIRNLNSQNELIKAIALTIQRVRPRGFIFTNILGSF